MTLKTFHKRLWTGVPAWIFIGAVAVLFPIFAFMTMQSINRQKENSTRLLLEKGAALIRSFEAGARTGMGMRWSGLQLQKLLTETAQQPDILHLLVTDINGVVMTHNNPAHIGKIYAKGLDLKTASFKSVQWRLLSKPGNKKIFEVFRRLAPAGGPLGMRRGHMMMQLWIEQSGNSRISITPSELIIFVGLDMSTIDEAIKSDTKHAVVMGLILLFIGFTGIIFLFLAQSYREVTSFNNVAASVMQLSLRETIGEDAEQVLPAELWALLNNPDLEKGIVEKEIDCIVANGKKIPLEVSATLLYDESETFLGYVLLFKDLSEVRALRKEIARSQRLASVGRLAAGVAHEIRNPLSSIKGFATYFKERYHDIPEDQHISSLMIQEVDRLNRVVGELHEFARPITIARKPIQIKSYIENSIELIANQASAANVTIQTTLAPEIDEVYLDPDKISQVLLNLYLNAIESMDSGGTLSVGLSVNAAKEGVEIRISDSGAGISKDDLAHIFDPYFTTKAAGTGLGLAIVHNIIEAHQGEIKVESQPDQGTTFTIFLPNS
ncbi:MAG: PAS domain-containing protein [Deltaproteobacteria bacterium]|nr:PAS domain-containing protein [Deltaproteobacteria bacterium]